MRQSPVTVRRRTIVGEPSGGGLPGRSAAGASFPEGWESGSGGWLGPAEVEVPAGCGKELDAEGVVGEMVT